MVEVEVNVNVCASSGDCYVLRVPDAEVVLNTLEGRQVADAKTAEDGIAQLRLSEDVAGRHNVVVRSLLWKEREKSYLLMVVAGSHHQLALIGTLG